MPVLKLEENDPKTVDTIRAEIRAAFDEDRAEAILLCCAGMRDLMLQLSEEFGLPVVDGVACSVTFAEALVKAKLTTSKLCSYA